MSGVRRWVVTSVAGVSAALTSLFGAATVFDAHLSGLTSVPSYMTPDGPSTAPPSPVIPLHAYWPTVAVSCLLISVIFVALALSLWRESRGHHVLAGSAVSLGPLAVLILLAGWGMRGDSALRVMTSQLWLGWMLMLILPPAAAWVGLAVVSRQQQATATSA